MTGPTYHEVWKQARLAGFNLVMSTDGYYAVCDGSFKTLVKCNTLGGCRWFILNSTVLSLSQVD